MVNSPLIRPAIYWGRTLDSHDGRRFGSLASFFVEISNSSGRSVMFSHHKNDKQSSVARLLQGN